MFKGAQSWLETNPFYLNSKTFYLKNIRLKINFNWKFIDLEFIRFTKWFDFQILKSFNLWIIRIKNYSYWKLFDLKTTRIENHLTWKLFELKNFWFENYSNWEPFNLKIIRIENHSIWKLFELKTIWFEN